jgi:hypothetical protein
MIDMFINTEASFTKIEVDKETLFFRSTPNKVSFDRIIVRNTGTTCVYFKWRKLVKPFNLENKRSEGIDRFFCYYVILSLKLARA